MRALIAAIVALVAQFVAALPSQELLYVSNDTYSINQFFLRSKYGPDEEDGSNERPRNMTFGYKVECGIEGKSAYRNGIDDARKHLEKVGRRCRNHGPRTELYCGVSRRPLFLHNFLLTLRSMEQPCIGLPKNPRRKT
jgi:hypothetical protein